MRTIAAWVATWLAAALMGAATALAGRIVHLLGLYEVAATLVLSVVAVTVHHLCRAVPGGARYALAALAAATWIGCHLWVDAWSFRREQGEAVVQEAALLARDFVVAGAGTPLELVDAGLRAETGQDGVRGALLVQAKAGLEVQRTFGATRVWPMPRWGWALARALQAALVALGIARALKHLATEPRCDRCGRYLDRRVLGRLDDCVLPALQQAWQSGRREVPEPTAQGQLWLWQDTCPAGHTAAPGYAIIRPRQRRWSMNAPGPLAQLKAVSTAPPTASALSTPST